MRALLLAALAVPAHATKPMPTYPELMARGEASYAARDAADRLEDSRLQFLRAAETSTGILRAQALWRLARTLVRFGEQAEGKKERRARFQEAWDAAKEACELDPSIANAHYWRGIAMGRWGETRGIVRSAFLIKPLKGAMAEVMRLDPRHGGAWHVLGMMDLKIPGFLGGSKSEAVKKLLKAQELEPNRTRHPAKLAEVYRALDRRDEEIAALKRVLAIEKPDDRVSNAEFRKEAQARLRELNVPGF